MGYLVSKPLGANGPDFCFGKFIKCRQFKGLSKIKLPHSFSIASRNSIRILSKIIYTTKIAQKNYTIHYPNSEWCNTRIGIGLFIYYFFIDIQMYFYYIIDIKLAHCEFASILTHCLTQFRIVYKFFECHCKCI